jgi:poly(A) polymerase
MTLKRERSIVSENKSAKPTQKMATSREIIDRLFWDVRLNRHVFVVGFQDRQFRGILEKSLVEWMTQSDIPEHRVRYIRCDNAIVWDRENRLDLVSAGQLPDAAWTILETEPVLLGFELRSVYVCGGKEHREVLVNSPSQHINISQLKVVSFNVLCDAFEPEGTPTQQRLDEVVRQLQQCDADIVAIQEASPAFLSCLLAQDWMRGYCVSEVFRETISILMECFSILDTRLLSLSIAIPNTSGH